MVVVLDEGEHLVGEVGFAGEGASFEQAAGEDREEDLDLVEPGGVGGGELKAPARMGCQPVLDLLGAAGGEVVADRDHLLAGGDLRLELVEEAEQVELLRVEITRFR